MFDYVEYRNLKTLFGKRKMNMTYDHVDLSYVVGKTVECVCIGELRGAYGWEPCTVIYFTDNTRHAFVHPQEQ
jgi:hypothetical protein